MPFELFSSNRYFQMFQFQMNVNTVVEFALFIDQNTKS